MSIIVDKFHYTLTRVCAIFYVLGATDGILTGNQEDFLHNILMIRIWQVLYVTLAIEFLLGFVPKNLFQRMQLMDCMIKLSIQWHVDMQKTRNVIRHIGSQLFQNNALGYTLSK
jgi:hypothetical protein